MARVVKIQSLCRGFATRERFRHMLGQRAQDQFNKGNMEINEPTYNHERVYVSTG